VRRLLLVPALAVVVTAAVAATAGAGDQRTSLADGVSVVLPAGWHVVHHISDVTDPVPAAFATFRVRLARQSCECGMPNVAHFPRAGAFLVVWEYRRISRRDLRYFPVFAPHFRIRRSAITGACAPSDGRTFRESGRGFQVEIYLGPEAPASARAQIAAILDTWRVA
jgi:hypothetical protein